MGRLAVLQPAQAWPMGGELAVALRPVHVRVRASMHALACTVWGTLTAPQGMHERAMHASLFACMRAGAHPAHPLMRGSLRAAATAGEGLAPAARQQQQQQ